jgi:hypothetical protein
MARMRGAIMPCLIFWLPFLSMLSATMFEWVEAPLSLIGFCGGKGGCLDKSSLKQRGGYYAMCFTADSAPADY